jgi:hypothetical protein
LPFTLYRTFPEMDVATAEASASPMLPDPLTLPLESVTVPLAALSDWTWKVLVEVLVQIKESWLDTARLSAVNEPETTPGLAAGAAFN